MRGQSSSVVYVLCFFCSKAAYPTDGGIPLSLYHTTTLSAPINQLSFSGVCVSVSVSVSVSASVSLSVCMSVCVCFDSVLWLALFTGDGQNLACGTVDKLAHVLTMPPSSSKSKTFSGL